MPAAFGKSRALTISVILHLISIGFVFLAGMYLPFGKIYWLGAAVFSILVVYQHLLVKPNDLSKVNLAFFSTNGIASIAFATFVISDLLLK